jgi:D-3-phosphoglycerate dehydrogenase
MKNTPARLVYLERFAHPIALELLAARPHIEARCLERSWNGDRLWSEFAEAHVYQIRATRSDLPAGLFANAAFLDRCPQLLAVSANGSGADTIDIPACTAAGVLVVNQAGGNKQAVAEHAIGMMLCLTKRIFEADRAVRTVPGLDREGLMGHDMFGKTLGIIGLGNIGRRVSELVRGLFQMHVLAYDPFIDDADFAANGAEKSDLESLLERSDFITVHCPRNPSSEHMLDARAFARVQPHAYFVNTARGGIHVESDLAHALREKRIAGAGLDVWEQEPPPLDHPLLGLDNVIVSPHTAGVTHEARRNIVTGTIEQIDDIVSARRAPRILNPEVWERYCGSSAAVRPERACSPRR